MSGHKRSKIRNFSATILFTNETRIRENIRKPFSPVPSLIIPDNKYSGSYKCKDVCSNLKHTDTVEESQNTDFILV